MKYTFNLLWIAILLIQCGDKKSSSSVATLGEIKFDVTGSKEAMPYFQEGLLLLHSFEFEDAAEKFVQAQAIDSNFVMAYWGEAMSYNHPLWRERFSEEGSAALNKLAATKAERLALAKSPLEHDLLEAVEILYKEGDKKALDIAYKNQMEKLNIKYPDNHEVAAFYALSLLGSSKSRTEDDHYAVGAKIVQGIIDENPQHPGALHYLIHSYDDPDHAKLALDAAHSYAKVAPDAEHALHMPSHIFVALGMWDEVIKSNVASYDASVARMKVKELDNDARGYHAFKWLMYGYLQKGNFEKAKEMIYEMKTHCAEKPSSKARAHFVMMKGDYLSESGDWTDSIAHHDVVLDKLNILVQGVQVYTQGMLGYYHKDKEALNIAINELGSMQSKAETEVLFGAAKMCSGVSRNLQPPTANEVNSVKVLENELKASLALLKGDEMAAEKWMKAATEIEENTSFSYGPPNIVKPSFELYGEWLVSKGRNQEAQFQFDKVQERAPKRLITVQAMKQLNS